jgi:AAA domain
VAMSERERDDYDRAHDSTAARTITVVPRPEPESSNEDAGRSEETAGQQRAETLMLSKVTPRALQWFWKSRIPRGAITMHDGDPDLGKSITWIDIAARCSRTAGEFPDREPCGGPKKTLLLSAEDPVETVIRPRFDAAGGDPEKVILLRSVRRCHNDAPDLFSLSEDLEILEEVVKRLRPDLVVIDPITAYLGAANSWKDQEVRRVLAPLAALAEKYDFAVILIRHLNKATKVESILYRGGGSIGIIGAARSGLLSAKDPDDSERRLLATYKHNLARGAETLAYRIVPSPDNPDIPIVQWLGSDARSAEQINAAAGETFEQKSARGDARGFLRELLADGPITAADVEAEAKKAGIASRTLARACTDLKVVKKKMGFQMGWTWSLP